ncbi:MAG: AsmA family protein [Pseudoflavonifractor sp.]|nr:AsmA family protein [Alloprevotella sp.]MCM1116708.1 AsmA family protein [Pseudoflavonifractor sp.]
MKKLLKALAISAVALVLLLLLAISVLVTILTPQRLTPMVNRYATEYLLADVEASRVELTFWTTFPRLTLDVDSLTVTSRAPMGDDAPSDYSCLASLSRLTGTVDIMALLAMDLRLHNLEIDSLSANLIKESDSLANYLIIPSSAEPEVPEPTSGSMPFSDITIDHFAIIGPTSLRYRSIPDSIDVTVSLSSSLMRNKPYPSYSLSIEGIGGARIADLIDLNQIPFGLNGSINWDTKRPDILRLNDFSLSIDSIDVNFSSDITLGDTLTVTKLGLELPPTPAAPISRLASRFIPIPAGIDIDNLNLALKASLTRPFAIGIDSIPSLSLSFQADGRFDYDRLHLSSLEADIKAAIDGANLDASTIEIGKFKAIARAIGFELNAFISSPVSDAKVKGRFQGGIMLNNLPRKLYDRLGLDASGLLTADASFRLALSDISPSTFHRMKVDGCVNLSHFKAALRDSSLSLSSPKTRLNFGTASTLKLPDATADSLLTLSLSSDSITAIMDRGDIFLAVSRLHADVGMKNIASSTDTSQINPIGANIRASLVRFASIPDTLFARLYDSGGYIALSRFHDNSHIPQLHIGLHSGRARITDPSSRASLRDANLTLKMNPRPVDPSRSARRQAALDSLRSIYPGISDDSLRSIIRSRRRAGDIKATETIDFGIDRSLARRLRQTDAHGSLVIRSGHIMSRYFPIRSRLSRLGVRFSTDSVAIDSGHIALGKSGLDFKGSVTNISRALSSSRSPLEAHFTVMADTVDINEIADALFAGADYSTHKDSRPALTDDIDDNILASALQESLDSVAKTAFLIPSNIDAELAVNASNVFYSDIHLTDFIGHVAIHDGALNLDRLSGHTSIGSMTLSALYQAPEPDSLRFAMGMNIKRLQLNRFIDLIPQVDSIMPLLSDLEGIINADIALSTDLDPNLDIRFNTLEAIMRLSGDSLKLLDSETFRTMAKWLMFKDKQRNIIDSMTVELMVRDSRLSLFPFIFNMDRYRLGVSGSNDLNLNLDYHVAVLKSPIPFRFGINIKGNPDKMKFSVGKARFDEKHVAANHTITDTARVNLLSEISRIFRSGVSRGRKARLSHITPQAPSTASLPYDTLSRADSLILAKEGLIQIDNNQSSHD